MSIRTLALLLLLLPSAVTAEDPVVTDGDKYTVLLDNDQVRVLRYEDHPGDRTHEHRHPEFVLYALAPFRRRILLPDGKVILRDFKAGDVLYSAAQVHTGENVGDSPTLAIMVEIKRPAGN